MRWRERGKKGRTSALVFSLKGQAELGPYVSGSSVHVELNERSGLTNFAHFVVGGLPQVVEVEPNDEFARAQRIDTVPTVINGRIDPQADLDVYRFSGKAGQNIVAAIAADGVPVALHVFLDGRDTPPRSALEFLTKFSADIAGHATITPRSITS